MLKKAVDRAIIKIGENFILKKGAAEIFAVRLQELSKEEAEGTDEIESGLDELIAALKRERGRSRRWEP